MQKGKPRSYFIFEKIPVSVFFFPNYASLILLFRRFQLRKYYDHSICNHQISLKAKNPMSFPQLLRKFSSITNDQKSKMSPIRLLTVSLNITSQNIKIRG